MHELYLLEDLLQLCGARVPHHGLRQVVARCDLLTEQVCNLQCTLRVSLDS